MKLAPIRPTERELVRMSALKALSAGLTIIFHREGIQTPADMDGDARTTGEPARLAADARTHREMGGAGLGGALA